MNNRTHLHTFGMTVTGITLYSLLSCITLANAVTLTGTVSSQKEGMMEGVLVNAKQQGGTIMVTVVSDARGKYTFPDDKLTPGTYDISIRAVGYKLPATSIEVNPGKAGESFQGPVRIPFLLFLFK